MNEAVIVHGLTTQITINAAQPADHVVGVLRSVRGIWSLPLAGPASCLLTIDATQQLTVVGQIPKNACIRYSHDSAANVDDKGYGFA